jgi:hypothetical protein
VSALRTRNSRILLRCKWVGVGPAGPGRPGRHRTNQRVIRLETIAARRIVRGPGDAWIILGVHQQPTAGGEHSRDLGREILQAVRRHEVTVLPRQNEIELSIGLPDHDRLPLGHLIPVALLLALARRRGWRRNELVDVNACAPVGEIQRGGARELPEVQDLGLLPRGQDTFQRARHAGACLLVHDARRRLLTRVACVVRLEPPQHDAGRLSSWSCSRSAARPG